jgi:hypothetical protein
VPVFGSFSEVPELFFVGLEVITGLHFALGVPVCHHKPI